MSRSKLSPDSTYVESRSTMPGGCPVPASSFIRPRRPRRGEALPQGTVAELTGDRQQHVVRGGLADADPDTLARERPHSDAGLLGSGHEGGGLLTQRQP